MLSESANAAKFNMSSVSASSGPPVLVAALDWGLGHATRCFPIIRGLQARGIAVQLGGSGASGRLLRTAFPELPYHELPSHTVRYARTRRGWLWKMLEQLPRLRHTVAAEKRWLNSVQQQQPFGAILSDNRYGLYHPGIPCVFITHQLAIRTPFGAAGNALLRRLHYRLIQRFSACWVPDGPAPGLAGALAHPPVLPQVPTRYIGSLSRFAPSQPAPWGSQPDFKLVILLSGPEPQRSIWEAQLLAQAAAVPGPVLLLRGLPGDAQPLAAPPNLTVCAHLPADELEPILRAAPFVVARCGYSTVMDLAALRVRGILVPTPGQTEQEYLARHLQAQGFAPCFRQEAFHLAQALETAANFPYRFPEPSSANALDAALDELVRQLHARTAPG